MNTTISAIDPTKAGPAPAALKILAPIDPSADSTAQYAIDVARALGASLTLLHVADARPPDYKWLPGGIEQFTIPGRVPQTVAGMAEYLESDMVLMTSRHYRRWKPFWTKSLTAKIIEATDRPVLITALPDAGSGFRCRTILCVLSLDGRDSAAIVQAEALAKRTGGELILLSVVPEADEALLYEAFSGVPLSPKRAATRVRRIANGLSVPYEIRTMSGPLEECISIATREHAVDLVVVNREALDPRALFRRIDCPLLAVVEEVPAVRTVGAIVRDSQPVSTEETHAVGV
jgi:nucleotide-binding universal stress UspA family protein